MTYETIIRWRNGTKDTFRLTEASYIYLFIACEQHNVVGRKKIAKVYGPNRTMHVIRMFDVAHITFRETDRNPLNESGHYDNPLN